MTYARHIKIPVVEGSTSAKALIMKYMWYPWPKKKITTFKIVLRFY